jgi:hypothetical protein
MKKLMVFFIVVILALGVSILSYAQNPEGAKPQEKVSIEQRKAKFISSIDQRVKLLQELKTCISAAQTPEDLSKCREKFREAIKANPSPVDPSPGKPSPL